MEQIVLKVYDNSYLANVELCKLRDCGIGCYILNPDEETAKEPLNGAFQTGVKLIIKKEDEEKARALLKEFEDQENRRLLKCPHCGSSNIVRQQKTKYAGHLLRVLVAIIFAPLANRAEYVYRCKNCNWWDYFSPADHDFPAKR